MAPEERQRSLANRLLSPVLSTKAGSWYFLHVANRVDRVLMPATRGWVTSMGPGMPIGLLYHVGAKTGAERVTPLTHIVRDGTVILVASSGGAPRHPAWYFNLRANPEVEFLRRGGRRPYTARDATEAERDDLWQAVNDLYAGYEVYQGRTGGRRIPIVILEPR